MNQINYCALAGLVALVSGCASPSRNVVLAPVGPPPFVNAQNGLEGNLVVYSASGIGSPSEPDRVYYHSDYRIYSQDGKPLKWVRNRAATGDEPALVSLEPGRYKVVSRAAAFGPVTVPVVIEPGKTTFLHLDGSELTSGKETSANGFVRLPDGLIIGWRATENDETK